MTITGGCRCGVVRYSITSKPLFARHCWCRDCQYIGAGSGTVNVFFPSEAVKVEGDLADYQSRADSGTTYASSILRVMWDASVYPSRYKAPIYRRARRHA